MNSQQSVSNITVTVLLVATWHQENKWAGRWGAKKKRSLGTNYMEQLICECSLCSAVSK